MRASGPYVLDADVFIAAKNGYYAFDLVPQFWDELTRQAGEGRIVSIDKVADELDRFEDELSEWAGSDFCEAFATTDEDDVLQWYRRVMTWSQEQEQYHEAAKREFAQGDNADPWLVAYAGAKDCTVVTNEKARAEIKKRIPIPNVCEAFGVACCDVFVMMRHIGMQFG